jgi:hypothetical protein
MRFPSELIAVSTIGPNMFERYTERARRILFYDS